MSAERRFEKLLQQVREGSEDAANELAKEYGKHVLRVVRRALPGELRRKFDSVDFEQKVWKSFFAEARNLPDMKEPTQLIVYLASMAEHKVLDENRNHRAQKRDIQREVRFDEGAALQGPHPVRHDPTPSEVAVFREEYGRLVKNQPERVRKILELKVAGLNFVEIAREVGLSDRTVRTVIAKLEAEERRREQESP
jgi:RNA polymerase sigma factor (sigma-70 family)